MIVATVIGRHAFIAELRTPRASRSVRGRPFLSLRSPLALNLPLACKIAFVGESGSKRTRDARAFRATQCIMPHTRVNIVYYRMKYHPALTKASKQCKFLFYTRKLFKKNTCQCIFDTNLSLRFSMQSTYKTCERA